MSDSPTVLVTGGTGFIGARLVAELVRSGNRPRALSRDPGGARWSTAMVDMVRGDLATGAGVDAACAGVETVFHLAGYAHAESAGQEAEALHRRTTVEGTRVLLDAAVAHGVRRIVFLSSVKAAGEATQDCVDESEPPKPSTPYGRAKRAAEIMVLETAAAHGLHGCVLRLPLVYGPDWKGNLAKMAGAIARGRFPPPPRANNRRSMVHVDDVVQALLLAAEMPDANGRIFFVTDGRTYSTREIYEWICEALGRRVPGWSVPMWVWRAGALVGDMAGHMMRRTLPLDSERLEKLFGSACYRSDRIVRELGFRPRHDLHETISQILGARAGGIE